MVMEKMKDVIKLDHDCSNSVLNRMGVEYSANFSVCPYTGMIYGATTEEYDLRVLN